MNVGAPEAVHAQKERAEYAEHACVQFASCIILKSIQSQAGYLAHDLNKKQNNK